MKFNVKYVALMLVGLSLSICAAGSYAQGTSAPVTIVSHVDVKPDSYLPKAEETAEQLFRGETTATKLDAGLISYVVLQEIGSSNHFTIVETWRDATAYQMHTGSPHTVKFRTDIQPLLGSPFDSRIHHLLR